MRRLLKPNYVIVFLCALLTACSPTPSTPPTPTAPSLADQITVHSWDGGMSQSILDAFTAEYGVAINYVPFTSYIQARTSLANHEPYDVVFISNDYISEALDNDLLAELNVRNIPNMRNIAVNFRDLTYDPGNRYSVPYTWGTTGIVFRADLFDEPITRWDDLWDAELGQAGIWDDSRSMIGMTLLSLGYSANSSDPAELEAALERLLELKARGAVFMEQFDPWTSAPSLDNGTVSIALGWAYDALAGRDLNSAIEYIIPEEGTVLWLENMIIPTSSPNKATAELFINFMLRPEIAAQIANSLYYAVTVETAREFIEPDILNDPAVYPTSDMLINAELTLPLSPDVQALYNDIWQRFLDAPSPVPESTPETIPEVTPEATQGA